MNRATARLILRLLTGIYWEFVKLPYLRPEDHPLIGEAQKHLATLMGDEDAYAEALRLARLGPVADDNPAASALKSAERLLRIQELLREADADPS
jgi:hypothetical protein